MVSKVSTLALAVTIAATATAGNAEAQGRGRGRGNQARAAAIRFQSMDQNRDGAISKAEWRGSPRSFAVHDWNGDGTLAGDEVRVGGSRATQAREPEFDSSDREYVFDDWTERGFRTLDHNRDNRITRDEWHFDREGFRYVDHNDDNIISRAEFLAEDEQDDDRDDRFPYMDLNLDGRLSKEEWHGSDSRFAAFDTNRDGFLSRQEVLGNDPPPDLFTSVDVNRDRAIGLDEWHWSRASFDQRDSNKDGRLTLQEFDGTAAEPGRSSAWRAGFERGQMEGRQAGRDERANNRGWDLEGQSELDNADSGYQTGMGPRAEYQAGYRDGFRRAYREGWNGARGN